MTPDLEKTDDLIQAAREWLDHFDRHRYGEDEGCLLNADDMRNIIDALALRLEK